MSEASNVPMRMMPTPASQKLVTAVMDAACEAETEGMEALDAISVLACMVVDLLVAMSKPEMQDVALNATFMTMRVRLADHQEGGALQ